ncbi:2-polyprenyl-3-methyl-6-methoxy-1,4-benzoquinone monooxygenase [Oxalobacteraceae bacterium CAVE-383]|nr:2-polyprenyl-3-methyl-6-methoxy-1,4-benzoquinone monooxygenase [Oxalobacteraceae bacterium CAVE-383]
MDFLDRCITDFDKALKAIAGIGSAARASPAQGVLEPADQAEQVLSGAEQRHSAALMRVNHVGEVCAQALYDAQGRFSRREETRRQFELAAREEADHLAWTVQRVQELGSHVSLLNPLWYGGAYLFGTLAARMGDARNLGFVAETERQVAAHLSRHLEALPARDAKSRAIVEQMRSDEIAHGDAARALGAAEMPAPVRGAMRAASKVMTTVAYYI